MSARAIQDEYTGEGTYSTRFYNRRIKSGICVRCPEPAMPGKGIGANCSAKLREKYQAKKSKEVAK